MGRQRRRMSRASVGNVGRPTAPGAGAVGAAAGGEGGCCCLQREVTRRIFELEYGARPEKEKTRIIGNVCCDRSSGRQIV